MWKHGDGDGGEDGDGDGDGFGDGGGGGEGDGGGDGGGELGGGRRTILVDVNGSLDEGSQWLHVQEAVDSAHHQTMVPLIDVRCRNPTLMAS